MLCHFYSLPMTIWIVSGVSAVSGLVVSVISIVTLSLASYSHVGITTSCCFLLSESDLECIYTNSWTPITSVVALKLCCVDGFMVIPLHKLYLSGAHQSVEHPFFLWSPWRHDYRPISRVVIGREVDKRSRLIYVRYCLTNTTLCL